MTINVLGRDIHVDDTIANIHKTLYNEPVNEALIVSYLFSEYGTEWERELQNRSVQELQNVIEYCLKFEE